MTTRGWVKLVWDSHCALFLGGTNNHGTIYWIT
jgi:superoxide dismutase